MKPKIILCLALILSGGLYGCATVPSAKITDVRAKMLAAAGKGDPDFPDGRNLVLTHFSHVGQLTTSQGKIVYIADRHSVTANALSPHGQKFISFFDEKFLFLGKIGYGKSSPLWCEGSKLYLWGDLDRSYYNTDLDRQLGNIPSGNVIDVANGFENLTNYHAYFYGSSGGLEDEWTKPPRK